MIDDNGPIGQSSRWESFGVIHGKIPQSTHLPYGFSTPSLSSTLTQNSPKEGANTSDQTPVPMQWVSMLEQKKRKGSLRETDRQTTASSMPVKLNKTKRNGGL